MRRIRSLRYIERFNFHYVSRKQTVAEHSYFVAYYAMVLARILGEDEGMVCKLAILHDTHEVITGDIPHLYERIMDVKVLKCNYQDYATEGFLGGLFDQTYSDRVQDIVDFADLFELKIYLEEERKSGNMHLWDIEREVYGSLLEFDMNKDAINKMLEHLEPVKPKEETIEHTHEGDQWKKLP